MKKLLWFRNPRGLYLEGDLLLPDGNAPSPVVVFAHELLRHRRESRHLAVAERLLENRVASLLFDFTGHGESQGQPDDASLQRLADDLGSAIDRLLVENRIDSGRIGVLGSGAGAAAAVLRAAADKRIKALVLHNAEAGVLSVLQAATYVDVPALLIAGELDPVALHEMHALQFALAGETRAETVREANETFERSEQLRRVVDLSTNWLTQKLDVLAKA